MTGPDFAWRDDGDLQIQEKTNTEYGIGDNGVGGNCDVDNGDYDNGDDDNSTSGHCC